VEAVNGISPATKDVQLVVVVKIAEFEAINRRKCAEEVPKQNICYCYFRYFSKEKPRLTIETVLNKNLSKGRSNNTEVLGGRIPQLPGANGGSEAEPPTLRRFYSFFFQKICSFRHILV